MKTFEEFQNKRYDLQENKRKDDLTSSPRVKATGDILKSGKPTLSQRQTADNVLGNLNRFFTDKSDSETMKTKPTGDENKFRRNANRNVVNRELKKTIPGKSKPVTVGALDKRDAAIKKLDKVIIKPKPGDVDKTKKLIKKERKKVIKNITSPKQGEKRAAKKIIKKINTTAQDYTNKINQERELKVKAADKSKQFKQSFGKPTGASPYTGKPTYMKPGVVTGEPRTATKSDGRGSKKTLTQLKKDIELKDLQKSTNYKVAGIERSKELKRLNKEMGEKALASKIKKSYVKTAQTFAPSTKADRQFYKAGRKITKILPKKAAPVAKKGLKLLTKAGPAGRIAGAVGLAMLSPGVRKTAAKVLGATAVGLGLTKAAGSGGGKTPVKSGLTGRKYGINLSQKDNK